MIFDDIRYFFTKEGELDPKWSSFMITRWLSFSFESEVRDVAISGNRYQFKLDKELMQMYYGILVPYKSKSPFLKYIKKPTEIETEFSNVLDELQKQNKWTDDELNENKLLIIQLLRDKKTLEQVLFSVGAEEKEYKKHGIVIPEEKENEQPKMKGLMEW